LQQQLFPLILRRWTFANSWAGGREIIGPNAVSPCTNTISELPEMVKKQRLKSERILALANAKCQGESVSGAGFQAVRAKLCGRFAKVLHDG
jgi:hypothetical protein